MAKRARQVTDAHAVVVLAAGGSTRLGQPKQLLTRQGETLVHRVVRLARELAPAQVLVVVGANAQAVTSSIAGLDATPVTNHHWERGLASSLQVAGAHLLPTVTAVMVVACDQPAIERSHLQALLSGARASASGCAGTRHGDALGIPAVVPRAWFNQVGASGDRGFERACGNFLSIRCMSYRHRNWAWISTRQKILRVRAMRDGSMPGGDSHDHWANACRAGD